jgi:hypothetical protein
MMNETSRRSFMVKTAPAGAVVALGGTMVACGDTAHQCGEKNYCGRG